MSMRRYFLIWLGFGLATLLSLAEAPYFTRMESSSVKTLQVKVAGQLFAEPYLAMGSDEQMEISFDVLGAEAERYAYTIIHCDADWNPSSLSPIEYLDGFQGLAIEDFANSSATTVQYVNYRLLLPNEEVEFKVSGNYAVRVYREDQPDETAFIACFSLVEPLVHITGEIRGNTDIDTYQTHQQLSFSINHKNFPITYPQSDLKIRVCQNRRRDRVVRDLTPTSIRAGEIDYTNNRSLIFDAGNEYRRFEFLSNKYNGMHIEGYSFHNPYYHVDLAMDGNRGAAPYEYDQDQDGRFFIRCSNCNDPDTEADYYIVHFTLAEAYLPGGQVYLSGDLLNNRIDETSRMTYNAASQCYEKSLLLKQGSYNYQYLFLPEGESQALTAPLEGNYHQTENEYTIYIYYRPIGARYDRLIGLASLKNEMDYMR